MNNEADRLAAARPYFIVWNDAHNEGFITDDEQDARACLAGGFSSGSTVGLAFAEAYDDEERAMEIVSLPAFTPATPIATDAQQDYRHKLWMVLSHASGGHLSDEANVDRSVNDLCVEISRHHNRVWEAALDKGCKEASATAISTLEAEIAELVEGLKSLKDAASLVPWHKVDAALTRVDALLSKHEEDRS